MTITTTAAKDFLQTHIGDFLDEQELVYEKVDWPNAPFDQIGADDLDGLARVWAAVRFSLGERRNAGIGTNKLYRTIGICSIMLFTPLNKGEAYIDTVAESIRANYEGSRLNSGTIRVRNPRIATVGVDNGFWRINVDLPFEFDSQ